MTEAHEINGLQNGYVHTKPASLPEPAPTSRPLPQSPPTHPIEKLETSPVSSKSKQSTQLSANHASQSTNAGQREWSPPSTAFSSQEQLPVKDGEHTAEPSSHALDHAIFQDPLQSTSTRESTGSPSKADALTDVVTERKRTASGQSKRASISSIHDLKVESSPGRSRASTLLSTTSNGNVMEVSHDFLLHPRARTRIYAHTHTYTHPHSHSLSRRACQTNHPLLHSLPRHTPELIPRSFPSNCEHVSPTPWSKSKMAGRRAL